jgi:3-oxoacyl-[acyl-carrier protein] reductase
VKKAALEGISETMARQQFEASIPVKRMGKAEEMAVLACWLLSPLSGFVTGQSFSHDGGLVRGLFG